MPVDHDPMHAQGICWLKPIDVKKPKHTWSTWPEDWAGLIQHCKKWWRSVGFVNDNTHRRWVQFWKRRE
jgi:hypothetical protein